MGYQVVGLIGFTAFALAFLINHIKRFNREMHLRFMSKLGYERRYRFDTRRNEVVMFWRHGDDYESEIDESVILGMSFKELKTLS